MRIWVSGVLRTCVLRVCLCSMSGVMLHIYMHRFCTIEICRKMQQISNTDSIFYAGTVICTFVYRFIHIHTSAIAQQSHALAIIPFIFHFGFDLPLSHLPFA